MSRLFTVFGAMLGLALVPLASISGGCFAMLRHAWRISVRQVERDVLDQVLK